MDKLYRIKVTHFAPRDSHLATDEYVVAENDRQVFEYLAHGKAYWKETLDDNLENYPEETEFYREEYENILTLKGDYERELTDLFYGATIYGWEEVELTNSNVIALMIENSLAKRI